MHIKLEAEKREESNGSCYELKALWPNFEGPDEVK